MSKGVVNTGKFVMIQNFLQAKALLEHSYVVFVCSFFSDIPLFACGLVGNTVIFAEYILPNAVILRHGDWSRFFKLYSVAKEFGAPMYTIMQDR